jgi:hypothetical protein
MNFYNYCLQGGASAVCSRFSDGKGAIVMPHGQDGYLYAFAYDVVGGNPSISLRYKSDQMYCNTAVIADENLVASVSYGGAQIGVTDFDGDGNYEIYIGNKVFSLDGLNYLTGMPDVAKAHFSYNDPLYNNQGYAPQNRHQNYYGSRRSSPAGTASGFAGGWSIAVDLDADGKPELVCGGVAYKVTKTGSTWGMSVYKRAPEASLGVITTIGTLGKIYNDGRTCAGDFNNDGYLDILVSSIDCTSTAIADGYAYFYGWDVHNNAILFADTIQATTMSYPFVGDIDGDGHLEIGLTIQRAIVAAPVNGNNANNDARVVALKLPSTFGVNKRLTRKWMLMVWETGCRTGLTVFDFNNDGKMEIVYRDMQNLRIMNANASGTLTNLMTSTSGSSTQWEMPLVADIDNDGAAEIICTGSDVVNATAGRMRIYKSGSSPWAPARKVWNQYAYNPTFVNEDLSIPAPMFNPAEKIKQTNGSTTQPFNHFLQQVGEMNAYGETLNLGPNLLFNPTSKPKMNYNAVSGAMEISCSILNNGNVAFTGQYTIALYAYTSSTSTYTLLGTVQTIGTSSSSLAVGASQDVSYNIASFMSQVPPGFDTFFLFINSNTNGSSAPTYPFGEVECNYNDNLTGRLSFTSLEKIVCEGTTEILKLSNSFDYKWYTAATGGSPLTTEAGHSNWYSLTKNSDERTLLFVENYQLGNLAGSPISPFRDTLFIYRTPDSLIWTGAYNGDWHYHENWSKPGGGVDNYPDANVPRACTNVLIPDGLSAYPNLSAVTGGTGYADYPTAWCNRITINHGGEVKQPDSLHYARAAVDVTFSSNRWYMWSPPLKDLYPGDIYVSDKNPYLDAVYVYTKLFSKANPQTGYLAADWTGNFITPVIPVTAGDGMRVWVDDHQAATVHDPYSFAFPKWDAQHHIYGAANQGIYATYNVPSRADNGRFIFDGLPNASTKNFTVSTPGASGTGVPANSLWLVGNPFMAHIDFAKFYAANSTKIKNHFRIMTSSGSYEYYNTLGNTLNQYIAPMQSFIVEAQTAFSSLTFNANMTVTRTGSDRKLRAAAAGEPIPTLSITLADPADRTKALSQIFIVALPGGSNALDDDDLRLMTNVYVNPEDEPAALFSKSIEETPSLLSVNCLDGNNLKDLDIPLGLRGAKAGAISLLIQGQTFFADGYELNLFDRYENKRYNLRGQTWFTFDNLTATEQLDDRFVIETGLRSGNGIDSPSPAAPKTVVSKSYYDLTGRPVSSAAKGILIQKSVYDDGSTGYGKVYVR